MGVGNRKEKTGLEERQMPSGISSNYDGESLKEREDFGSNNMELRMYASAGYTLRDKYQVSSPRLIEV